MNFWFAVAVLGWSLAALWFWAYRKASKLLDKTIAANKAVDIGERMTAVNRALLAVIHVAADPKTTEADVSKALEEAIRVAGAE